MNNRRKLLVVLGAGALMPHIAFAQVTAKVYRIGFLVGSSRENTRPWIEAFVSGLKELGYIEGRNLMIDYRFADGKIESMPALAAELVAAKPDLIFAPASAAVAAVKRATSSIPIVFAFAGDPVTQGFVQSLAHPGGNLTGLSSLVGIEVVGKRVELLKEAVPNVNRVCVWYNPDNPTDGPEMREFERAAKTLAIQFLAVKAQRPAEYEDAAAAARKWGAQAIFIAANPSSLSNRKQIIGLVARLRLPAMYWVAYFVEDGGLMAYAPNFTHLAYRAATYADKILKGAKPADIPVEQPTKLELVINLKTATALGIKIPNSILVRADRVIE